MRSRKAFGIGIGLWECRSANLSSLSLLILKEALKWILRVYGFALFCQYKHGESVKKISV